MLLAVSAGLAQNRGNQAVYRLYAPSSGEHLLTRDCNEKQTLTQTGQFQYEGVAFYVSAQARGRTVPLHRLVLSSGEHLYTVDSQEMNNLRYDPGNRYEAVLGYISAYPQRGTIPLYRLYNGSQHFFTTSEQERNDYLSRGGRQEGIMGYVWTTGNNPCDSYGGVYPQPYPNPYPNPNPYPYPGQGNRNFPTIYTDSNFGGSSQVLQSDWAGSSGIFNNTRLRSNSVPNGWTVTVFDRTNFRGRSQVVTGNWSPAPNDYWYSRVKSIRVQRGYAPF
jgi:hypothetical protein